MDHADSDLQRCLLSEGLRALSSACRQISLARNASASASQFDAWRNKNSSTSTRSQKVLRAPGSLNHRGRELGLRHISDRIVDADLPSINVSSSMSTKSFRVTWHPCVLFVTLLSSAKQGLNDSNYLRRPMIGDLTFLRTLTCAGRDRSLTAPTYLS